MDEEFAPDREQFDDSFLEDDEKGRSDLEYFFDIDVDDDDGKDETNASHASSLRFILLLSQFELLDPSSSFSSSSSMGEEILFF